MTKTGIVTLCIIAGLWGSTGANAQTIQTSEATASANERVQVLKSEASANYLVKQDAVTVQLAKTKPVIKVVRRSVPRTNQTVRTGSKGFVLLAPETVTDDMTIYRSAAKITSTPNLYRQ